jgi:hypothetical protein
MANCITLTPSSLLIEKCPYSYYCNDTNITKTYFHLLALTINCNYDNILATENYEVSIKKIKKIFKKWSIE